MAHTYTNLLIHGLFSTKERRPVLDAELRRELFAYMGGIIAHLKSRPLLINGPKDHVHLFVSIPTQVTISRWLSVAKGEDSAPPDGGVSAH